MPRVTYVNGRYMPHDRAAVHVEDRGFQFADSVYEVIVIIGGKLLDERGHLDRLERSLSELRIPLPMQRRALALVLRETVRRNTLDEGLLYIQVSRGVAPRDFRFPKTAKPTLVVMARASNVMRQKSGDHGITVITFPDLRWKRPDIKTTGLLAQVFAKQAASEAGAQEAWMVDAHGFITEGSSSNAWILTADGALVTRQADHAILKGVTRSSLQALCRARGIAIEERPFTVAEAFAAREAFVSSASTFATPVVRIDGHPVGDGRPGTFTAELRSAYLAYAVSQGLDAERSIPWSVG
jgi:D-alanine transaminase